METDETKIGKLPQREPKPRQRSLRSDAGKPRNKLSRPELLGSVGHEYSIRLRALREHASLTQRDASAKMGVPQTTLARAEMGATQKPNRGVAAAAAALYNVSADWILYGVGQVPPGIGVLPDVPLAPKVGPAQPKNTYLVRALLPSGEPLVFNYPLLQHVLSPAGTADQLRWTIAERGVFGFFASGDLLLVELGYREPGLHVVADEENGPYRFQLVRLQRFAPGTAQPTDDGSEPPPEHIIGRVVWRGGRMQRDDLG